MALRYATPEEELEQAGSVMAPEKSGFQRLADFFVGSTPAERLGGFGTLGLGALKIVKPSGTLAEAAGPTINKAVRGLGREYIQYMRNKIRQGSARPTKYQIGPNFPTGRYLREAQPLRGSALENIVQSSAPNNPVMRPEQVLQHELTHGKYYNLPKRLRAFADKEMGELSS